MILDYSHDRVLPHERDSPIPLGMGIDLARYALLGPFPWLLHDALDSIFELGGIAGEPQRGKKEEEGVRKESVECYLGRGTAVGGNGGER